MNKTKEINSKTLKVQRNATVTKLGTRMLVAKLDIRLTNGRDRAAALDFCRIITQEVKAAEKAAKKASAKRAVK